MGGKSARSSYPDPVGESSLDWCPAELYVRRHGCRSVTRFTRRRRLDNGRRDSEVAWGRVTGPSAIYLRLDAPVVNLATQHAEALRRAVDEVGFKGVIEDASACSTARSARDLHPVYGSAWRPAPAQDDPLTGGVFSALLTRSRHRKDELWRATRGCRWSTGVQWDEDSGQDGRQPGNGAANQQASGTPGQR